MDKSSQSSLPPKFSSDCLSCRSHKNKAAWKEFINFRSIHYFPTHLIDSREVSPWETKELFQYEALRDVEFCSKVSNFVCQEREGTLLIFHDEWGVLHNSTPGSVPPEQNAKVTSLELFLEQKAHAVTQTTEYCCDMRVVWKAAH